MFDAKRKPGRPPTQEKFAKKVDLSQPEVSKMLARGILTRGATIDQWEKEYIRHLRQQAAQHKGEKVNLVDERARLAQMQTARIGFDLARERSEFLARDAIAHEICASFAIVRSRLLQLPTRVHSENQHLPTKVFTSIESIIRECLDQLARTNLPPAIVKLVQELDEAAFHKACEESEASAKGNGSPAPKSAETD
jgi:hypothetical protein